MIDLLYEIFQTMRTNKLRTVLTGISVSWGIMMLIVLVGMSQGLIDDFMSSDFAQSPNVIHMWNGYASKPWEGLKSGRAVPLRESNADDLARAIPDRIEDVSGELSGTATISTVNDVVSTNYSGVHPSAARQMTIEMTQGRFINNQDLKEKRKVIVMEKRIVERLFGDTSTAVGRYVKLNSLAFQLVGYYNHRWRQDIFIPYTTAKSINGYNDKVNPIRVTIKNVSNIAESEALENDIREVMSKANHHAPDDASAVWIWNAFSSYQSALEGMSTLTVTMWIIGILTLLTGIVGVSNIMFVSVRERTHEIGVRRAIGARPRSILSQIILESVALTSIFGYIGILSGTAVINIIGYALNGSNFFTPPHVNFSMAVNVAILMIVTGAVAGIFPARRALKINAVEALRSE